MAYDYTYIIGYIKAIILAYDYKYGLYCIGETKVDVTTYHQRHHQMNLKGSKYWKSLYFL